MKKFEDLEHTADLGLRVFGNNLAELLANAAEGMFSLIGRAQFEQSDLRQLKIQISGARSDASEQSQGAAAPPSYDKLLYDWLRRLLQEFNLNSFFPVTFDVRLTSAGCSATIRGGSFDPAIHTFYTEIKAVTLHALRVDRIDSQWVAEVIFDV